MNKSVPLITVSIVSHGHGTMVERLVHSVLSYDEIGQVLVTNNVREPFLLPEDKRVVIIQNDVPRGFAENHNAAFEHCQQPYFCVLNPDISFEKNPFPLLIKELEHFKAALAAPFVYSCDGQLEDSVRYFPTITGLFAKATGGADGRYAGDSRNGSFFPDWVAGMFMLFRSNEFREIGGFDEAFYLYYEDVDICARLWKAGKRIVACPNMSVIHDARRASRSDAQHMKWHATSMARYFWKHWMREPRPKIKTDGY